MNQHLEKLIEEVRKLRHNYSKFETYGAAKMGNQTLRHLRMVEKYCYLARKDLKMEIKLAPQIEGSELLNNLLKLKKK